MELTAVFGVPIRRHDLPDRSLECLASLSDASHPTVGGAGSGVPPKQASLSAHEPRGREERLGVKVEGLNLFLKDVTEA